PAAAEPHRLTDERILAQLRATHWLLSHLDSAAIRRRDPEALQNRFQGIPATGQERGCYTDIELWLGVKEPTWIRGAEEIVGAVLFLGIPPLLVWSVRRFLRRRNHSASTEA
ncbi:MAG TPA: hypothetical protein VLX28_14820, partial [Thermoanaerobaculia bacterium]|nr:hypothetical protein [Thermoanaerobaculia bacterium]